MAKKTLIRSRSRVRHYIDRPFRNPELIFGLVGPIGVDLDAVSEALDAALREVYYTPVLIHLSKEMRTSRVTVPVDESSYFTLYKSLMKYGNKYREIAKSADALAGLAILEIRRRRRDITNDAEEPALGHAYIVRQFKRTEEIELMRRVYGARFVQVSVYGSESDRRAVITDKIRHYDLSPKSDASCERQAIKLIDIDNNETGVRHGQRVSDAFPLGDVFIDGIKPSTEPITIRRFVRALCGNNAASPTKDEYGLYMAASAALRSVDLSRQVGAAICTISGEIISLGCNEVPKAGGGTYWVDEKHDIFRDIERGRDANHERRNEIFYDLVQRMGEAKLLSVSLSTLGTTQERVNRFLSKRKVKDAQLMDIIEFGRMIHAEMSAISDAARLGRSTKRATLYCTTFPCHMCAKHIVASGIRRVVFLEPYPKSYALKLHSDSITFSPSERRKVLFEPFIGIAPVRYRSIFEKGRRKDSDGVAREWYEGTPAPLIPDRTSSHIGSEIASAYVVLGTLYGSERATARR